MHEFSLLDMLLIARKQAVGQLAPGSAHHDWLAFEIAFFFRPPRNNTSCKEPTRASKLRAYMLIPVCCFSCNRRIGEHWIEYCERIDHGDPAQAVLDDLGMKRQCCRRMLMTGVELNSLFIEHELAHQSIGVTVHRTSPVARMCVLESSAVVDTA